MGGLEEMLAEGEPLMRRAMQAVRRYHEARDSSVPRDEVARLLCDVEALMRELSAFQQRVISRITPG